MEHEMEVETVVCPNLSGPVRAGTHGETFSHRRSVVTNNCQALGVDLVDKRIVSRGNVCGIVGVRRPQAPEDDVGVVVHVEEPLSELQGRPVVRLESRRGDGGHNLVVVRTPLVVGRLYHSATVEDLPCLGEGDLVELAPAVCQVAVPSLLRSELFLAGTILDVGALQPGGQLSSPLPHQGNVVELCRFVAEERLPSLESGIAIRENIS